MHDDSEIPVVMSLSHHDPSGSSGIQADIETAASLGCHCTTVITSICAKATGDAVDLVAVESPLLIEQARAILEDMPIKAIKLGFLGSIENIEATHTILRDYPHIPVVLEPATSACTHDTLLSPAMGQALLSLLLPLADVVTTDIDTLHELAQQGDTVDACAQEILDKGCPHLLVSAGKCTSDQFENCLYGHSGFVKRFSWKRLHQITHGGRATLSASLLSYLAHGFRVLDAVEQAQNFTWQSLVHCRRLGMGKRTPNRFFWTQSKVKKSPFCQ